MWKYLFKNCRAQNRIQNLEDYDENLEPINQEKIRADVHTTFPTTEDRVIN